uniref:HU domain-containing protein n=1 Tax=Flavobacterium sp. TaxID=239 RepID=UPI00404A56BC
MRIEQSITELLYRYQCVTIPGFGAFLSETIPSQYFPDTQTFFPPKKLISFNLHIKNNDGLLANHLAQKEQVTYDVAVRFIAMIVEDWKALLNKKEVLVFEKVGKIILNQENNLVFTPFDLTNFYLESFGLSSLQSKSVIRFNENLSEAEDLAVKNETIITEEQDDEVIVLNPTNQPRVWVRYAAVAVLVLGLSGVASGYFYKQKVENDTKQVAQKVQEQVEQKIQEATFFIDNPLPAITLTLSSPVLNYHVVGGAFKEIENAETLVATLKEAGFDAKIGALNKFDLYPVFYGSYATNEEAVLELEAIKSAHNQQAWILFSE